MPYRLYGLTFWHGYGTYRERWQFARASKGHALMPKPRTAPAWRRAFLRELARTGSVAAAAAKVGIDRSSAYQARKRNPAFLLSWDRAQEARERLQADGIVTADRYGQLRTHPCVNIERDAKRLYAKLVQQLGLDVAEPDLPAAGRRSGLRIAP